MDVCRLNFLILLRRDIVQAHRNCRRIYLDLFGQFGIGHLMFGWYYAHSIFHEAVSAI